MSTTVGLRDASTRLSTLVELAAQGEEIIITKNGVPMARLVRFPSADVTRSPAKALGLTHVADDFDAPDQAVEALFK